MEEKKGLFITFEGPEGMGKSTQVGRLYDSLIEWKYDVVKTYEPNNEYGGCSEIYSRFKSSGEELSSAEELDLIEKSRRIHCDELILPSLDEGKIVICDRFGDSTIAYQGYGRNMCVSKIMKKNLEASRGRVPDITFLLDGDVREGLARARGVSGEKYDRFEEEGIGFHERVAYGFRRIAENSNGRIRKIDFDSGEIDEKAEVILDNIVSYIFSNGLDYKLKRI
jgi:dTMP kinase